MFQESQTSGSNQSGVYLACGQHVVAIVHLDGGLSLYRATQRYASDCYLYPFRRNQESCDATVLFIDCLHLLFGTQGRPRSLKPFFLQTRNGTFVLGKIPQGPAWFQSPLYFDTPQS